MHEHASLLNGMFIRPNECLTDLIIHPDDVHLRMQVEMFALSWDGKVPNMSYQSNDVHCGRIVSGKCLR